MVILLFALFACKEEVKPSETSSDTTTSTPFITPPAPVEQGLSAREIYTRASLDLRGRRPSLQELRSLSEDDGRLNDALDELMLDEAVPGQIADLFAGLYRTRVDYFSNLYDEYLIEAASEEPTNLISVIVANDLPYSQVVQADFTVVHPRLLGQWPLEEISRDLIVPEGTVVATYTDSRPMAGVLSTNAMWARHTSTLENANRGRANALVQAFLCESYLDRPILFPSTIDLSNEEAVNTAIRTNNACTACHSTLDPLAGYLWGFMASAVGSLNSSTYAPEREMDWVRYGLPPAFFGVPGDSLTDLGYQISADERFAMCAVKTVTEGLLGRPLVQEDDGALADHREVFLASGMKLSALARSVLSSPAYQNRSELAGFGGRPQPVELKTTTPLILGSQLRGLTGFQQLDYSDRDALSTDYGLRAVAGGSDRGAAWLPSMGLALTQRRLGEGAANGFVAGEGEGSVFDTLISRAELSERPTQGRLSEVFEATLSREPEAGEIGMYLDLWDEVEPDVGAKAAWGVVLTALLADPEFTNY